jgi:hypothetical protein
VPRQPVSDADYLGKLQDYYAEHQVFPSYAAIGELIGLSSTSSVSAFLGRLKDAGYIDTKDRRLRPGSRFFERPAVQSRVAAGLPSMAHDGPAEGLAIDAHLIKRPSRTFLLQVKGDSMQGAGIRRRHGGGRLHGQAPRPGETPFCAPTRSEEMRAYPISTLVNNARNEGPELLEPV